MKSKKLSPAQIIEKLRLADIELAKGRKALDFVAPRQADWANEIGGMHSQRDLHSPHRTVELGA
jgi:hypothetical protein